MTANNYVLVSETDDWVEKILNKPDELKLTENTLVIFLSDHGEMPGQYGMCGKFCFYDKSVRPKYDFTVSECSWEKVNVS